MDALLRWGGCLVCLVAALAGAGCFRGSTVAPPDYTLQMANDKAGPPRPAPTQALADTSRQYASLRTNTTGSPGALAFDGVNLTTADRKTSLALAGTTPADAVGPVTLASVASEGKPPAAYLLPPPPPEPAAPPAVPPAARENKSALPPPVPLLPPGVLPPPPGASSPPGPQAARTAEQSIAVMPPLVVAARAGSPAVPQGAGTGPAAGATGVPKAPARSPIQDGGAAPAGSLTALHQRAAASYGRIASYTVKLTRREQLAGAGRREEVIVLDYRKSPRGIYLRWVGGEGAGREAVYVPGRHGDKVHIRLSPKLVSGNPPGGRRDSLPPDCPVGLPGSRQLITDLGIDAVIARFGTLTDAAARGDLRGGSVRYLGQLKRTDFEQPVEAALHAIPPGVEPALPRGGQRWWCFDCKLHMPVLVVTCDEKGREVDYARYDEFRVADAGAWGDDPFNPDVLWGR